MRPQHATCRYCLEPITRPALDAWWSDHLGWVSCPQMTGRGLVAMPHEPIPRTIREG